MLLPNTVCFFAQLMAMLGEVYNGLDSLKTFVEKMSEIVEKGEDTKTVMVCMFNTLCPKRTGPPADCDNFGLLRCEN